MADAADERAVTNFRDFGGDRSRFGGRVATGLLFRSGHLGGLDAAAAAALVARDFAVVVDLRYAGERAAEASPWPAAIAARVVAHEADRAATAPHLQLLGREGASEADVVAFFARFYAGLPFDPLYRPLFARALGRIAVADGPVLIHCAAGKDRTGVLCALLLDVLGVERGDIRADYMRTMESAALLGSAARVADAVAAETGRRPDLAVVDRLLEVRAEYIDRSFAAIEAECGSVEGYCDAIGVDAGVRAALRGRLLVG